MQTVGVAKKREVKENHQTHHTKRRERTPAQDEGEQPLNMRVQDDAPDYERRISNV